MNYNTQTKNKIDKFIKESNEAGQGFDETKWDEVEATIPAGQRADAEKNVRSALKA